VPPLKYLEARKVAPCQQRLTRRSTRTRRRQGLKFLARVGGGAEPVNYFCLAATRGPTNNFGLKPIVEELQSYAGVVWLASDRRRGVSVMNRRTFIVSTAGSVFSVPFVSRAQKSAMPVIGFLNGGSPTGSAYLATAFRQGLRETGYVEGQSVAVELLWVEGQRNRLSTLVAELVQRPVALIAVGGGSVVRLAAKAATATIPIVFVTGGDPISEGLVPDLGRPAGNITGVTVPTTALNAKRLEFLNQLVPPGEAIAILANPTISWTGSQANEVQAAARTLNRKVHVVNATNEREIEAAFASLATLRTRALLVSADPMFNSRLRQLVDLTQRHRVPAIFEWREFATAGGLMSYGSDIANGYREAGVYAGRILNGTRPSDLPVLQATKYEFVINLTTAKALGLTIPQPLLIRADEVIQ
jgi:putative tryptophan/tyrosine transport system substrate-binding protein